jgi:anti-sigma B factor antagonist
VTAEGVEDGGLRRPALAELVERHGTVVVGFQGELDLHNAEEIRAALEDALGRRPERLVVDLSDVEFLDSTALGALLQARRRQAETGSFRIAAPGIEPRRVLRLAGVERHLDVFESLDEALT